MLEAYGGKCAGCGIDDPVVLTLDHIHGGGGAERKSISQARDAAFYSKRLGYPKDRFQLLCANCNMRKMVLERRQAAAWNKDPS